MLTRRMAVLTPQDSPHAATAADSRDEVNRELPGKDERHNSKAVAVLIAVVVVALFVVLAVWVVRSFVDYEQPVPPLEPDHPPKASSA